MNETEIIQLAKETIEKGNILFPNYHINFNDISFGFRLRNGTAGVASISTSSMSMALNFNLVLAKANPEDFQNTVIHEVSHLFAFKAKDFGHGYKWKFIFKTLGGNGQRFHKMVNPNFIKYVCKCGRDHNISPIVHRKILRGAKYSCKICGSVIVRAE